MQFTSLVFLLFMAVVFLMHWAVPARYRWGLSLAASFLFYSLLGVGAFSLLLLCCAVCYTFGILLEKKRNKYLLFLSIFSSAFPLLFFKYYHSFCTVLIGSLLQNVGITVAFPALSVALPVGLSFYTFKMISYLADIYLKKISARKHFGHVALYLTFFPEINSGPIQRAGSLLPQIEKPSPFSYAKALSGVQLILWGLFKKVVIADNLAYYVDIGFSKPDVVMGVSIILAAFMYSIQLYCDFSGYSDIAIGCMNLLGYDVEANFKSPYFATSIREFWSRWHLSLSGFLRDYIYIPLGGNRKGKLRQYLHILITFFVSGIWHGTGITFIIWGLLHGVYQIVGNITAPLRSAFWRALHLNQEKALARTVKTITTFLLVTVAWVIFRADTLPAAFHLFSRMPDSFALSLQTLKNAAAMLGLNTVMVLRLGVFCGVLFLVDWFSKDMGFTAWLTSKHKWLQTVFCYFLVFSILFFGISGSGSFIYFQF